MIEIRNLLFGPLTFQLAGDKRGLHLGSRQRRLIEEDKVSDEIRTAAKRGFVSLTSLNDLGATEETTEAAPDGAGQAADATIEQQTPASPTADSSDTAVTDSAATESLDETAAEPQSKKRR